MKTIDMFANVFGQAANDSQTQKYGAMLLARGAAGAAKLNPAVVWVDAAIAVIEAAGAYFTYCAACEVTKQLREYNRVLEVTLAQALQVGELELAQLRQEHKGRQAHIARLLQEIRCATRLSQKQMRGQFDLLRRMQALLQQQRLQSGSFEQLIQYQICLDQCIDATLTILLSESGE
jgi:hypothetical protein